MPDYQRKLTALVTDDGELLSCGYTGEDGEGPSMSAAHARCGDRQIRIFSIRKCPPFVAEMLINVGERDGYKLWDYAQESGLWIRAC